MFRMVLNSNDVTRLFYKIIFTVQVNTDHVLRLFLKGENFREVDGKIKMS